MEGTIQLKPPKTFEEQLEILQSRGLEVGNYEEAINILKRVNYYRFTAYTLTFKENDIFFPGTTFELIYQHYVFDAKLRNLLMEVIEYIEISFRTHIAYLIAFKYGQLGHEDSNNFKDREKHSEFMTNLRHYINRSKDPFIKHHEEKYNNMFPVWVAFEVLTFSELSKLFKNLKLADQKEIVRKYYGNLHHDEVVSWLHGLSVIRNRCAHYSRLFNQTYHIKPRLSKNDYGIIPHALFAYIFICKFLVTDNSFWSYWVDRLEGLIEANSYYVNIKYIGFPDNWETLLRK